MDKEALQVMTEWKAELEQAWRDIPKPFRQERTVRRTLQCRLFGRAVSLGFRVFADYLPPRIADRAVDLIVLDQSGRILFAVCLEGVITLATVKSLSSFEADHKIIYTLSPLEKKVQESRFFLKPDIEHMHVQTDMGYQ